ncbi:hypothetical protein E3N88_00223 [Mikania micrantha]|uniref:Ribosomal protein S7 domain-containing protein n=1 Tax=Mikania micrantha TaxID=192012 RepID=A0A5N6PYX2_9ASTR|nr:hypothetical protein E3N88_00223 [Mikania micrantha]
MLVNRILKHGKKSLAYQIIYRAVKKIQQKTETNPLSVLRQAIHGVTPGIAVKARRVGGSTHQVPIEIGSTQGKALAIRWLLAASRKRPGRNMAFKLSSELVDAAKGSGDAIRKREETHRMAEANRAFAHFQKEFVHFSGSQRSAPIATAVDIGILRIRLNDQWLTMALMGGFARIGNNEITVLVNDAEKSSDIDPQEAQQTLEIAEAALRKAEGKRQTIEANLALRRARTRVEAINAIS